MVCLVKNHDDNENKGNTNDDDDDDDDDDMKYIPLKARQL